MSISVGAINSKLNTWAGTSAGKAKIGASISALQKGGVSKTQAGSKILTAAEASAMANEFIALLSSYAGGVSGNGGAGSIPASVSAHFSSLNAGAPVELKEGYYAVNISFGDDLSRNSLTGLDDGPPLGEGISNIVALFNNGANAKGRVYGIWDGHGENPIWSQPYRPALGFMQAAKAAFESRYGGAYDVQIILGGDYGG